MIDIANLEAARPCQRVDRRIGAGDVESCRDFANWIDDLGSRTDLAAAAVAATSYAEHDGPDSAYVVTSEPGRYGGVVPVIGVG
jgi:hypothetical protein